VVHRNYSNNKNGIKTEAQIKDSRVKENDGNHSDILNYNPSNP